MKEQERDIFGLTYQNLLFYKVGLARGIQIIRQDHVEIVDTSEGELNIGTNSFGEFVFVTLRAKNDNGNWDYVQFWGLGFHDSRDVYIDHWKINIPNAFFYDKQPAIQDKQKFIDQLICRHKDESSYWADHLQSEMGSLFSEIADLTDEDGALAEFQDGGLL